MTGRSSSDENGASTVIKKGAWTEEEDKKLVDHVEKHGLGSWRGVPELAGLKRCSKSCRLRWTNYLRPDLKKGNFSEEEDRVIIHLHALLGNKWSTIAGHLPGRTDNDIKNYWNTRLKKKLVRMGVDPVTHRPLLPTAPHLHRCLNHLLLLLLQPQINLLNPIIWDINHASSSLNYYPSPSSSSSSAAANHMAQLDHHQQQLLCDFISCSTLDGFGFSDPQNNIINPPPHPPINTGSGGAIPNFINIDDDQLLPQLVSDTSPIPNKLIINADIDDQPHHHYYNICDPSSSTSTGTFDAWGWEDLIHDVEATHSDQYSYWKDIME